MSNRRSGIITYLVLLLLLLPVPARAQTAASATLSVPDLSAFPLVQVFLDVHDAQGQFIHDLEPEQIRVLEDGNQLPVSEISELRQGVQFVVAINPGPSLGVRDSRGISRYDYIKDALTLWAASRRGSTIDDLSLVITGSATISHVSDSQQWLETLQSDQVEARTATPSLDTLVRAVSLAADPTIRPGMGRAILFITPPVETQAAPALENLATQAKQQDVIVFVWVVSPTGAFPTTGFNALNTLAEQTGGSLVTYPGEEPLADVIQPIEEYLEPLRDIYHIQYRSKIGSSGVHQLAIQVQNGAEQIETNTQSFEIEIQPPIPAFISPPIQIQRKLPSDADDEYSVDEEHPMEQQRGEEAPLSSLTPAEYSLQVVFDFPDGRKRPIVQSELYVDGALVAENTRPPFDQFIWDLQNYTTDGTHLIQARATDNMGLVGASAELPVLISIDMPRTSPWSTIRQNLPILASLVALLAGAVLLLVLVVGGKLRPSTLRAARAQRRKADPVTQSVPVDEKATSRHLPAWVNRLQWHQRNAAPKALAFLSPISDTDNEVIAPPIPITSNEVILGSNPNQSALVLQDASVEGTHARLVYQPDGSFRLADEGSIAGTWINYTPISREGTSLEHGDLIHIGRMGFRFTLRQPKQVRKPVITPLQPIPEPALQQTDEEAS